MDNMQGIRVLIDRLGLPPRLKHLVTQIEEKFGPLEDVPEAGGAEVRRILGMVDGPNLLAAIVARLLDTIEVPADELAADAEQEQPRSLYERWIEAAGNFDNLTMLLIDEQYIAFDATAERLAEALGEHLTDVDRKQALSLPLATQSTWVAKLIDLGLDVTLAEESDEPDLPVPGYAAVQVLDMATEQPEETEDQPA